MPRAARVQSGRVTSNMRIKLLLLAGALALGGCATTDGEPRAAASGPVTVKLIAINDFHGNLEPPKRAITARPGGQEVRVPAGGAAYLASAINAIRANNPNNMVISAGDLISASPLISSLFLDEPTIEAMNLIRLDFNAVGNHEFDRGRAELLRIANGGCGKHTVREPCAVNPRFGGADFEILAANVLTEEGQPLLPAVGIKSFGTGRNRVQVGVIGMTLKETPTVVTPEGVAGLSFRDEAETVNAIVPRLKSQGIETIVVLLHQGAETKAGYNDRTCEGLSGDIIPILQRLSPEVDLVVTGHTHQAYICDYGTLDPSRPFLVTSAGSQGTLLTQISVSIDPATRDVVARSAENRIVQSQAFRGSGGEVPTTDLFPRYSPDPAVAALVERYRLAAEPQANRVVGRLTGPALKAEEEDDGESVLGNLIADAQLAATRSSGAQIAFMNPGGVRADLVPAADGAITYGQLFAAQPFGNTLVVKSFTGRQIKALLEQQWPGAPNGRTQPSVLLPSTGFSYSYDLSRPAGQRIVEVRLNGEPLVDERSYRVTMSNFLASGGDNFPAFREGTGQLGGPQDIDALEAHFAANPRLAPPATDRIRNLTPG